MTPEQKISTTGDSSPSETNTETETEKAFFAQDVVQEGEQEDGQDVAQEGGAAVVGEGKPEGDVWGDEELWEHQVDVVIPPLWQPMIPLILALASGLLMWFFLDEFRFALSSTQPVDLGSVADGCQPHTLKKLRHNQLIKLRGILPQPNLVAEARVQFRKRFYVVVLGCDMIISLAEDRYHALMGGKSKVAQPTQEITLPQAMRDKTGVSKIVVSSFKPMIDAGLVVQGRAVLALRSSTADNLRRFYATNQSVLFTTKTFLVYDGEHPHRMWWVWIGYVILSSFLSYNVWRFLRAARQHWLVQN